MTAGRRSDVTHGGLTAEVKPGFYLPHARAGKVDPRTVLQEN